MNNDRWHGKPYYSIDAWCKNTYGEKCYKIALNAGFTCPNRDGTIGTRGCIFCSKGGSGEFAVKTEQLSVSEQLQCGLELFGKKKIGSKYIAYFQAYTNTYAPIHKLESLYESALENPFVCGISIATRPDCIDFQICMLLSSLKKKYPYKFIWIELGLQTIHENTATFIRRGYQLPCFEKAYKLLQSFDIPVIIHIILGLPGETTKEIYETIFYINQLKPFGIKLQLLHILKETDLANYYNEHPFHIYDLAEYTDLVIGCVEHLSPEIIIHRLTGDGPSSLLIAPTFSLNKRMVLNSIHSKMKHKATFQGKYSNESEDLYGTRPFNSI